MSFFGLQGLQPQNRLRSGPSSVICSRCTSMVSVNRSRIASRCTSQMSLYRKMSKNSEAILCKICLVDYLPKETYRIHHCNCVFCKEVLVNTNAVFLNGSMKNLRVLIISFQCLAQYLSFEIMAGAYEISCPDAQCEKEGIFSLEEIEKIVGKEYLEKHKSFRLNTGIKNHFKQKNLYSNALKTFIFNLLTESNQIIKSLHFVKTLVFLY